MKKTYTMIAALLAVAMIVLLTGCGAGAEKSPAGTENGLTGTWAYTDSENEFGAVYVLREDGAGTYTMTVGEQTVTYELRYRIDGDHLLVTYVNNEIFTEDDVFDSTFRFQGPDTLILEDSFGEELSFARQ